MNDKLRDKRILIIGGSSGIGLAVAKLSHELGALVIIASRSAAKEYNRLTISAGESIETYSLDITSEDSIQINLKDIGNIDHLVFAVRPDIKAIPFAETDIMTAKKAFETKFWGLCRFIQQAQNRINQNGSIIITTGISGQKIYKNNSIMSVINGALETLCRSLAIELAPIRINCVSPGFVAPKTSEIEQYAKHFPLKRLALPEEIAESYIYLMTSTYLTGTTIVADGGARLI